MFLYKFYLEFNQVHNSRNIEKFLFKEKVFHLNWNTIQKTILNSKITTKWSDTNTQYIFNDSSSVARRFQLFTFFSGSWKLKKVKSYRFKTRVYQNIRIYKQNRYFRLKLDFSPLSIPITTKKTLLLLLMMSNFPIF